MGTFVNDSSVLLHILHNCGFGKHTIDHMTLLPSCPLHRQLTQTYLEWMYDPKLELSHESYDADSVMDSHEAKKLRALLNMM